jgi:serine/threonine-protein kinase
MIAKHLQASPIPPSQRVDKALSPDLERLILKCLAKDPVSRPQSAAQVIQALEWIPTEGWTEDQARHWWDANSHPAISGDSSAVSAVLQPTIAIAKVTGSDIS